MRRFLIFGVMFLVAVIGTHAEPTALACGGLFCQNVPVSQAQEKIIFTVNSDGTMSAYVQIYYTGSAPDFSWVVPVPNTPEVDVAEESTFDEITHLTDPVFVPPARPDCNRLLMVPTFSPEPTQSPTSTVSSASVEVLAQGNVGPYNYAVITSPDPDALISWLSENSYRVTPAMYPMIHVYTEEDMVFLAMKLKGTAGVQDIQPVKMTYRSDRPMIPLRLTAVAAMPNMNVYAWIFADKQAYTVNYAHPTIEDSNLRILWQSYADIPMGRNGLPTIAVPTNYLSLVDSTVDLYEGRALITEYANPTNALTDIADPLLQDLVNRYGYLTRFYGRISPEQMTIDPVFEFNGDLPTVSNIHNLTDLDPEVVFGCKGQSIEIEFDASAVPQNGR